MTVAIYGKPFHESFNIYVHEFLKKINDHKIDILIYKPFYDFLTEKVVSELKVKGFFTTYYDLDKDVDYMFSIGGDGTFLETVSIVRDSDIPVVGINTGRLGFLANISKEDITDALDAVINKNFKLESRTLVKLETSNNMFGDFNCSLNEVTVHKRDTSSMMKIHAYIDGEYLNSYWGDGLIIATPTGSTAYSLSVGGPIVVPDSKNFIISPIAPHNLTVRPIVVPDDKELKLKVEGRSVNYLASLDSRSEIFDSSIELKIKKADFTIKLLKFNNHSFYSTLRGKLMWGMDKRN